MDKKATPKTFPFKTLFAVAIIAFSMLNVGKLTSQTTTAFRKNYNQALFDLPGNITEALTPTNYVLAGTNLNFLPIYGTVSQLNDTGGVVWSNRYSDASIGFQLNDIKKDAGSSQYYTCGGSESNAAVFMVLDASGNIVLSKKFIINEANTAWFNRVIKVADGGYVAVGYVTGYDPDGAGPEIKYDPITYTDANGDSQTDYIGSPLIVKLDASGNHVWHKVFRYYIAATKNPATERIYNDASFTDVVEVSDGYVAVGSYDVNQHLSATNSDGDDATPTDALILKTTTAGVITFHKQIDNPNTSTSQTSKYLAAINTTSTGSFIVGGSDNSKELIQKFAGPGAFSNTFSRLFTYSTSFFGTVTDPADVSQIYEVNGGTDLITMSMYIKPLSFFSNAIHRVNSTATSNVWTKHYDFNLISILPRGGKVSDNGYISLSMTAGGTDYDYHVIKTDPNGDTPLSGCPPTSFSPAAAAGPTTFADPYYNSWSGTPGSDVIAISKTSITLTPAFVCTKVACIPPAAATTVTATPNPICGGQTTVITASGPATSVTYNVYAAASGGANLGSTPFTTPALSGNTTYYIETANNSDPTCVSTTRTIVTVTVNTPTATAFTALGPYCIGATPGTLSTTSNNGVTGTWSPATISTASSGTTTYTFTPTAGVCATTVTMDVTINANTTPTFTALGPYCVGASPGTLATTSNNGVTGTWLPATISTASAGTTTYTFTPTSGLCATSTTMNVTVNTITTTTFTALGPYCVGATPGTLSTTSNNGVTGTWSPATISTASAGTTTYTFTPTAGLCATTVTMDVTINANTTPTFTALGPYCVGASPGTLSTTSNNGVTGTWSPATVSTASTGTTTYTFTPTAGLCATTATMDITINTSVTPTFTALGPYCVAATPGTLPTTSTNSITGSWSPATVSTASAGTITYTFTPSGSCATTTTMDITVNTITTPTFTALGPYCIGAAPGTLPTTSNNGVTGTWSPSTISTASAGTSTYTFTPTAGLCATTATMSVTVSSSLTPTFTALGPYCVGSSAGTLPSTSNNGVTGTWSPATVSTASAGTTTYTFTPSAGSCATTTTMNITVNTSVTPAFTALGPYCSGAAAGALSTTSNNGVTGTWSPAAISTASIGTTTYTFTPSVGSCGSITTMDVIINTNTTPTFTVLGPYCIGATPGTLPTTSTNGITGTWSPSAISTTSAGTITYIFTPTAGLCATNAPMNVTINSNITPVFTALGPYCIGDTPGTLPTTSNNGVTGTWSPATVSTTSTGTTPYTFTPISGSCATSTVLSIIVNAPPTATITGSNSVCEGQGTTLTANGGSPYLWSSGQTTQSITVTPTSITTYSVIIGAGCTSTASINVVVNPLPNPNAGPDVTITQFTQDTLSASGGGTYQWTPSTGLSCDTCANPIADPSSTTVYCVTVTNASGCSDSACVTVTVDIVCGDLFVPTAFSPNGDGQNDVLYVKSNCIVDMDFAIFDRWGEKVFETNDVNIGWDGTVKGKPLDTAVFAYYLKGTIKGNVIDLHGNITLTK